MEEEQKKKEPTYDEIVAEIMSISSGIQRLLNSRLTEKAILVLIHSACPAMGYNGKPSQKQIKAILNTTANLKSIYLKKLKGAS